MTRELAINVTIDFKQIELKAKDCPMEDTIIKANEVTVKSWHIELVIGILVSVLLIMGFIIGYIYIKKKKGVTPKNAKVINDYTLDKFMNGNQVRINSAMILNEQAAHLSYSGKYEVEEDKFEISKKIGGGSFGSVYEGLTENVNDPRQKMKVAIKSVNNPLDPSQVFALMCEIKVLDKLDKHINLVNMIGACTAQHSTGKIWLILEYWFSGRCYLLGESLMLEVMQMILSKK